jgi:D-inositol-3-phosphate glycosyltransferase
MSVPLSRARSRLPRRVAVLSVHTSPLDQPGGGDAGGMNVYVAEVAKRLAALDIDVEIFTRATSSESPPVVEAAPGVVVRHVTAGPFEGLDKADLAGQLCAFAAGVLRVEAMHEPGYFDIVHSHYWLSGQVGWLAAERWNVPLVHSMHTMAKVKNALLAAGDSPEPVARVIGETQVVEAADRLIASTDAEADALVSCYAADPRRVVTVAPGVDLDMFSPGDPGEARRRLGIDPVATVLAFVGRIQPLKAPDLLLRAAAELVTADPGLRDRLVVLVVGAPSGIGLDHPDHLGQLAGSLGIADLVRFVPPVPQRRLADVYRAATLTVIPSYTESFGLVALESQACGTPVVAAAVGGLQTAVADGHSGVVVDGHHVLDWAAVLARLIRDDRARRRLARGAVEHAAAFGWSVTAARLLDVYAAAVAERSSAIGQLGRPVRAVAGR